MSEVNYHPSTASASELAAGFTGSKDFEFIELVNIGERPVDLRRLRLANVAIGADFEGVDFDFAMSSATQLGAGQRIVVASNPTAFRLRYGDAIPLVGPWQGSLSNDSEMITIIADSSVLLQFEYYDHWYDQTDGNGRSLELLDEEVRDPSKLSSRTSWFPSSQMGGTPGYRGSSPDFDHDGALTTFDIDLLFAALRSTPTNREFDLTGDDQVDDLDVVQLRQHIMKVPVGDANGDGAFNSTDLVLAFAAGKFGVTSHLQPGPRETGMVTRSLISKICYWQFRRAPISQVSTYTKPTIGFRSRAIRDGFSCHYGHSALTRVLAMRFSQGLPRCRA